MFGTTYGKTCRPDIIPTEAGPLTEIPISTAQIFGLRFFWRRISQALTDTTYAMRDKETSQDRVSINRLYTSARNRTRTLEFAAGKVPIFQKHYTISI